VSLPKTLFVATFDVAAAQRQEFDRWYEEVHVPDALGIPGYKGVQRYESGGDFPNASGAARYLNVYEVESAEAFAAGWETDYRRRSSEDFNRWAPALSNANVGLYVAKDQGGTDA
jgi:hypothetical protein